MDDPVHTKFENNIMEPFKNIIEPLKHNEWQIIISHPKHIVMNKKFRELDEINIEYKNSFYHFSLPINNSPFSYYKKIADEQQAISFFKIYIDGLIL
jgi:hypothetical protein